MKINDGKWAILKGICFLVLLGTTPAMAQVNQWVSPFYGVQDPAYWNCAKLSGYVAMAMDMGSTSCVLQRGYREINPAINLFIGERDPAPVRRQVLGIICQYTSNYALDRLWHRKGASNAERALYFGMRCAITGVSLYYWNHNRNLP